MFFLLLYPVNHSVTSCGGPGWEPLLYVTNSKLGCERWGDGWESVSDFHAIDQSLHPVTIQMFTSLICNHNLSQTLTIPQLPYTDISERNSFLNYGR